MPLRAAIMWLYPRARNRGNLADRKEHGEGLWSIAKGPADQPHWREPEGSKKVDRIRFGVHDHPDAAGMIAQL